MKKIVLSALLTVSVAVIAAAQCDKNIILTSSKTQYLDSGFTLMRTVDEKVVIEISKTEITIIPGSEDDKMGGTIQSATCNWQQPYKEGKSILRVPIKDRSGDVKNATITIEGKDGRLTLLLEAVEMPDKKIRIDLDRFEEKK